MSSLEVLKIDGDTGAPLRDPSTGETWQAVTGIDGIATLGRGANGGELYPGRTYILTEIHAPSGYVLLTEPREVVLSPDGRTSPLLGTRTARVDGGLVALQ